MAGRNAMMLDLGGTVFPPIVRAWLMSLRWRIVGGYKDRLAHREAGGPVIWAFWHSQMLFPAYIGRNRGVRILISRHRDGELVARFAEQFGLDPVRGSTSSGGAEAVIDLVRESRGRDIAFTPDGPRGPGEVVQPGVITVARATGMPIMPLAASAWPCKRFASWDRFMLPMPFARAAITIGRILRVPPDADRNACETARLALERELKTASARMESVCRQFRPDTSWPRHHHPYSFYDERLDAEAVERANGE